MASILRFSPLLLLTLVVGCMNANPANSLTNMPANTGFMVRESNGAAGKHKYSVFIPRDYSSAKQYPTIVFLHGIGESGSNGVGCTTVGLGPRIGKLNGNFPFIAVFPQTGWDWTSKTSDNIMMDALNDVEAHYSVDKERIALTGMSSGGKGTWVLGARHLDVFAALVPMGGYADEASVEPLAKSRIPIWALHNSGDFIVPVGGTRKMNKEILAKGGNIKYEEFDQGGHNCWDRAYDSGGLFAWLQNQRKSARA
jgi:predicted peptidase